MRLLATHVIPLMLLCLCLLAGCGCGNDFPKVEEVHIDDETVVAGGTIDTFVSFRAEVQGNGRTSPFSVVVNLPAGAEYQAGTSRILFQDGVREPDSSGVCPQGRSFLLYNIREGELDNPSGFEDDFGAALGFTVRLSATADDGEVKADAFETTPADKCAELSGAGSSYNLD